MTDQDGIVNLAQVRVACKSCSLYHLCLPMSIEDDELDELERIIRRRRPLARGEHLFRMQDDFHSVYVVRAGSLKTYTTSEDGQEQITGFHLPGELIGLDAICEDRHHASAKALESTSLCEIPFTQLEDLGNRFRGLRHHLLRLMSKEIIRDESMFMVLGKMTAEQRLASFLLGVAARFRQRGFSASEFNLSMSRNDIGNYLGLAVETISRLFTRFQEEGLLQAERKHVQILDMAGLQAIAGQVVECGRSASPPGSTSCR